MGKAIIIIMMVLLMAFVTASDYEFKYNPYTAKLDRTVSDLNWSDLQDYPVACPSQSYITQLNDSVTCTSAAGQHNSTSWNRSGTNVVLANTGDKVGIGTINPNQKLEVVGNVNVSGNITGNQIYAQMGEKFGGDTPMTVTFPSSGVYYNVTNMTYVDLNGFTYTDANQASGGSYLTAQFSGMYKAEAHFSGAGSAAGGAYGVVIVENFDKTINEENCYTHIDGLSSSQGFSISCIFDLEVGDTVNVQVEDEADPSKDIEISSHNIVLLRIGN